MNIINIEVAGEHYDALVFARGHVSPQEFDQALKRQGYADLQKDRVGLCQIDRSFLGHHGHMRITPDSTGEYPCITYLSKKGRGAFPVTYVEGFHS